jgi:hypothetical protein
LGHITAEYTQKNSSLGRLNFNKNLQGIINASTSVPILITPVLKLTTISWMEILGVDTDRDSLEKTLLGDSMLASERENKKHLHRQYLNCAVDCDNN